MSDSPIPGAAYVFRSSDFMPCAGSTWPCPGRHDPRCMPGPHRAGRSDGRPRNLPPTTPQPGRRPAPRVAGHDVVREPDAVRGAGSDSAASFAAVARTFTGREKPGDGRPAAPRGPARRTQPAPDELLATFDLRRCRRPPRRTYSGGMRPPPLYPSPRAWSAARRSCPRRADHRPRPGQPARALGGHRAAGRRRDDDPADHPVPGGGRPPGEPDRRDR